MRKFKHYPIYINYNIFTKEDREAEIFARTARFYGSHEGLKYTREMEEARRKYGDANDWKKDEIAYLAERDGKRRDEIRPGDHTSPEAIKYEIEVSRALETILTTPIGKTLLDLMTQREKIWIVMDQGGPGVASTTPGIMRKELGGGVRLSFDPWGGFDYTSESYTMDDVLFHELVHAYRFARLDTKGANWTKLHDYSDAEEFIATQMQNVYLSMRGKTKFYFSHNDPRIEPKDVVYRNIAADPKAVRVFIDFLQTEPLAGIVANWSFPDFNPWRDRQQFESLITDPAPPKGRQFGLEHLP